ncbi:hypothetical protein GS399_05030 [Pedobacter sp. HMF7647]|uniref:Uncharacterized protein n=1 Tax=Hufsiella arboris TaxID=2695275 RepID=A0A7K1Y6Y1_9SPHI|nr:hypothetical protein [Hufsiella arboris]MXV50327.1 hypothetical protein [Hufsiella arboris]
MNYFDFLASHSKVETVIGLLSFIVAAFLGYLTYQNSIKLKGIAKIISSADTQSKADLATALLNVLPAYKLPDLNQKNGFEIIKLQMEQKSKEFSIRMNILRFGMVLFFVILIAIVFTTYTKFSDQKQGRGPHTSGSQSPAISGNDARVSYGDTTSKDTSIEKIP